MAYAPNAYQSVGCFKEVEFGKFFEYNHTQNGAMAYINGRKDKQRFDHVIYVGPLCETRMARVMETVAYVIVDEDANGEWIVERWKIKSHRTYF